MEDRKKSQREYGKNARKHLLPLQRNEAETCILRRLSAIIQEQQAENVMIYAAMEDEVNLDALVQMNPYTRFCWPFCMENGEMVALCPDHPNDFEIGAFGIRTPVLEKSREVSPEEIDLVIVPCTAFDDACNRIGMGKGYYDRYLRKCVHASAIGTAFDCQKVENVEIEEWDYPLDQIVTEKLIYTEKEFDDEF